MSRPSRKAPAGHPAGAPETITMHFRDRSLTDRFVRLCRARGHHGSIKQLEHKDVVTVKIDSTRPATDKRNLIAAWSAETTEVIEGGVSQTRSLFAPRRKSSLV